MSERHDCTCGWGGVHDADNPRCAAYERAGLSEADWGLDGVDGHPCIRVESYVAMSDRLAATEARAEAAEARVAAGLALAAEAMRGNSHRGTNGNFVSVTDLRAALTTDDGTYEAIPCNCMVLWNGITEQHEWLNGSFDGSCGHPATGTKAEPR